MNDDARYRRVRQTQRPSIDGFGGTPQQMRRVAPYTGRAQIHRITPLAPVSYIPKPATKKPKKKINPLDMSLPGAELHFKQHTVVRPNNLRMLRSWAFRTTVAMLVLIIGFGGVLFAQGYLKLHKAFKGGATAAALQRVVTPDLLKGEGDGRINILLLGNGGDGHEAPDLTDTMMVASIDPVNKTADLVSIPRDMWVAIPKHGSMKINAAYETGKYDYLGKIDNSNKDHNAVKAGLDMADQTVEQVLGISIHYNVLVNFISFKKAVDTVGGVTVNVPDQLYDPTMAWENNWNPVLAKAGVQQMNGKQALMYARSRETSSDFARGERQRLIILALKEKVATLGTLSNPLKISQLLSTFGDNVYTDLSLTDASRLMSLSKGISNSKVKSVGFTDEGLNLVTTDNVKGQSVVKPRAGFNEYGDIQAYIRSTLVDGYILKEHSSITVLNGSGKPGLAATEAKLLKSYGYNVQTVGDAPQGTYLKTTIVDLTKGKDKYTKHYLERRFGVNATSVVPDASIQSGQAHFIIILGTDEATSSQDQTE
jgi:LCP family protein required for cell wall assembly